MPSLSGSHRVVLSLLVAAFAAATMSACLGAVGDTPETHPPRSSDKALSSFTLRAADNPGLTADVAGTLSGSSIALALPSGTDVTHLTPTVIDTGASVSPASGAPQDFTSPVDYTVTAADGSRQTYTATVSVAPSSAKDITRFTLAGVDGAIAGTNIAVTVPTGTDVTSLAPTIVSTGASVSPASSVAQDFTTPVAYTVTAVDNSTRTYTVTVTVAPSNSKDITRFTLLGVDGAIAGTGISLTLPVGTNLTSLAPTIVHTGVSISPASGVAADFTNPIGYTVTAADGSTQTYTVTAAVTSAIDLNTAIIIDGSATDVASWPQTTTLTNVNLNGTAVSVEFDKLDGPNRWPDECDLPGFVGCPGLQYTIWIFEYVGGQWYGTGAIEMWYGRADTGANPAGGTLEDQIQQNWVYYSSVMGSHALVPGEQIGFMVTPGDERRKNNTDLQERSNVVLVTLQ